MKPIFKVLIITVICIFLWIIVSNFKFDVPEKVVHSNNKTSVNNDEIKSKEVIEADDNKISDIDHYLKNSNFNGNITIYKNKKLVMNKGYGYRDFSREIKNDSNSMYLIGSANKFLTGLILIQLEDEKKLKLNDNVNKYILHFSDNYPLTIRDLMLHQSGLKKYNRNQSFHGLDESIAHIKKNGVDPNFYLKNQYNDVNYIVLSKVIENVTGMKYNDLLNKYLNKKSDLYHTSLYNDYSKSIYFTKGYFNSDLNPVETIPINLDQYFGAGNVYMSTNDLSKLMLNLKYRNIVSSNTKKLIFSTDNTFPKNYRYGFYVYPTHERIHGNFYGNDIVQYSNNEYIITLASNYLPKPYDNEVEKDLKHIFIKILNQPHKQ
ncbi:serine hydrolase domain-containing protein [Mammaliicoccus sciuri]|uniref:serine hydrolase domain-containing protein n=1 Tax=Mammaliicoccus sciuri TaxID=1296 RepID=UPI0019547887|nr:serine hydrolase domain-containing protein [Mammaliicoccus sciuri]